MKRFLPSPAMLIALIALFAVLGGTALASGLITGAKIKNSSITGKDVKNKSLTKRDFKGSVAGPRGPQGAQGAQGPQGAQGVPGTAGTQGPAGPVALKYITSADIANPTGGQDFGSVNCPAGMSVTGGGVFGSGDTGQSVNSSYPNDTTADADVIPNNGWAAYMNNTSGIDETFNVYAICTTPTAVSKTGTASAAK